MMGPFEKDLLKRFIKRGSACVIVSLVLLAGDLTGQSLEDLEHWVVRADERVQGSAFHALAEARKVSGARLRELPELSLFYRYSPGKFDLSEEVYDANFWMTARLSQDLVGLFKVRPARISLARADADLASLDLLEDKQTALFEFRSAYLDALLARERIRVYRLIIEQLGEQAKIAVLRFERKEVLFSDVLSGEKEILRYENMLHDAVKVHDRVRESIAAPCNIESQSLALVELGPEPEVALDELLAGLRKRELRRTEIMMNREGASASLSSLSGFHFTPFVGLRFRDEINWIGKPATEFGLRATVPLFQPLLTLKSKGANRYQVLAEKSQTAHGLHEQERSLRDLFERYETFEGRIRLAQKVVELKEEMLRIRRSQNQHQISSLKWAPEPVLVVERLQAELDLYSLMLEKKRAYFELLRLSGDDCRSETVGAKGMAARKTIRDAVWVWNCETFIWSAQARKEFEEFVQLNGIDNVFLSVNKELTENQDSMAKMHALISSLHQKGSSVSALIGDPHWVFPDGRERLLARIDRIALMNGSESGGGFDAVHLDIEPHALDAWDAGKNKVELINQLVESLRAVRDRLKALGTGVRLELDLPVSYGRLEPAICQKLVESVDSVTIMAYDCVDAQKLLSRAGTLVRVCVLQGRPFFIGLRSRDFRSRDELSNLKEALIQQLTTVAEFQGFALHDYEHGRSLK